MVFNLVRQKHSNLRLPYYIINIILIYFYQKGAPYHSENPQAPYCIGCGQSSELFLQPFQPISLKARAIQRLSYMVAKIAHLRTMGRKLKRPRPL